MKKLRPTAEAVHEFLAALVLSLTLVGFVGTYDEWVNEQDYFWVISATMMRCFNLGWCLEHYNGKILRARAWRIVNQPQFPMGRFWLAVDMKSPVGDTEYISRDRTLPFYFMCMCWVFWVSVNPKLRKKYVAFSITGSLTQRFKLAYIKQAKPQRESLFAKLRKTVLIPQPSEA